MLLIQSDEFNTDGEGHLLKSPQTSCKWHMSKTFNVMTIDFPSPYLTRTNDLNKKNFFGRTFKTWRKRQKQLKKKNKSEMKNQTESKLKYQE